MLAFLLLLFLLLKRQTVREKILMKVLVKVLVKSLVMRPRSLFDQKKDQKKKVSLLKINCCAFHEK